MIGGRNTSYAKILKYCFGSVALCENSDKGNLLISLVILGLLPKLNKEISNQLDYFSTVFVRSKEVYELPLACPGERTVR